VLSLAPRLDRPVVNQTGIQGRFDFHLEYAPGDAGPSISTALPRH
jgi:uncharacterized protein (TIGR03435 family)